MNIKQRISGYIGRSVQLAPLLKQPLLAPLYFASRHFKPKMLFSCQYGGRTFYARNIDYSAIREVFFESDYGFLTPLLSKQESLSVLDVGAHIGTFSLWALKQNPNLKILSIEASAETYSLLSKTVRAEGKQFNDTWACLHRAAWKSSDIISFSNSGDAMSHQVNDKGEQRVQGISLADLISRHSHNNNIDLLKVDIEGAEEAFLCEQPELLSKVDRVVVELHSKFCDVERVRKTLESFYEFVTEVQGRQSSKAVLYCRHGQDM